jgi:hypothetical protein
LYYSLLIHFQSLCLHRPRYRLFNVREALDDLILANETLRRHMAPHGLADRRALYSPELMLTQSRAVEEELMAMTYFGEPACR